MNSKTKKKKIKPKSKWNMNKLMKLMNQCARRSKNHLQKRKIQEKIKKQKIKMSVIKITK